MADFHRDFDCWARIDILADDTVGSTDVLSVAGASYMWCIASGCQCIACVYQSKVQHKMLRNFAAKTQLPIRPFSTHQAARRWCNEQMGQIPRVAVG